MTAPDSSRPALALSIRTAVPADAAILADLGARTFRDTFAAYNTPEDMADYLASHFSPALQEGQIRDPRCQYLLAEIGGTPAGLALLVDEKPEPGVPGRRPLMLSKLYVDKPYLSAGVGAALLRRCCDEARAQGRDVLWLGVWDRNERARAFYARFGFQQVGEMSFVLGSDVQRDFVLALPLSPSATSP